MTSNEPKMRILELTIKAIDGDLTLAESTELEGYIASSKVLADYYSACIKMHLTIVEFEAARTPAKRTNQFELDSAAWQEMALYEKIAPEAEVPSVEETPVYQKIVKPERTPFKISRFSAISVLLNAAAVLFIVLFIHYGKPLSSMEVATLTDSIDAQWVAGKGIARKEGMRFVAGDTFGMLQSGLIELLFDTNARVIIEGPAEFQIVSEQQIRLRSGKLYATVPQEAIGFTVNTRTARIVDMGTEFGVQVSTDGNTELHVIRGSTSLIAGDQSAKKSVEVCAGRAKRIFNHTLTVTDIPCQEQIFARSFDSGQNFVYRGQTDIDLTDIIGGGNGFGTGQLGVWLDVMTGKAGEWLNSIYATTPNYTDYQYHPVTHLPGVDGVFLPNGDQGPILVSAEGHSWKDGQKTSGMCFENITNCNFIESGMPHTLKAEGRDYGTRENPAIAMHSNTGMTFDLHKIQSWLPGTQIVRFAAKCGISSEGYGKADFWVLVDGEKRFLATGLTAQDGLLAISIPLESTDRFLTLVTTDNDEDANGDWGFFADPRIEIEGK